MQPPIPQTKARPAIPAPPAAALLLSHHPRYGEHQIEGSAMHEAC